MYLVQAPVIADRYGADFDRSTKSVTGHTALDPRGPGKTSHDILVHWWRDTLLMTDMYALRLGGWDTGPEILHIAGPLPNRVNE